jgi:hypothetical protein
MGSVGLVWVGLFMGVGSLAWLSWSYDVVMMLIQLATPLILPCRTAP